MILSKTYIGVPYTYSIVAAELTNVIILGVKKEGIGFTVQDGEIPVTSGMRSVDYLPGSGTLRFGDPFIDPSGEEANIFPYLERVWVMWKVP